MIEHTQPTPVSVTGTAPDATVTARGVRRRSAWLLAMITRCPFRRRSASDDRCGEPSVPPATPEPIGTAGTATSRTADALPQRVRDAVLADYHAENIRRARDAVAELIRAGFHLGPTPYGYRAVPVRGPARSSRAGRRVRLVADPVTGRVVSAIFRWRVHERLGHTAILARLTADPHRYPAPTSPATGQPGTWAASTIRHILANPRYTGCQVHGRRVAGRAVPPQAWVRSAPDAHEPLVEEATFARAQHRAPRRKAVGQDTAERDGIGPGRAV
ncbi:MULTISPECIES: recombinase family protein [unclassified Crossiella]|uniref:recombinase family protein n=1 Tax=unclassified Crossiella TaxID=2620835 RepID=UPI0020001D43|nr:MULTISPECIES: recombinase family protein [unclassified Crossiella]MCK2239785.1 recombinase family protein [Crossiella sp. S99.2]MCK2252480.1 recombinase family protein [Crossiella sp. S99.1]